MGVRALWLVALVGCGRWDFDDHAATDALSPTARPAACAPYSYPMPTFADIDLAAVAFPAGLAFTWAEHAGNGGNVTGVLVDHAMSLSPSVTVKTGTYNTTGLQYIEGHVVSAEVEMPNVGIKYDTSNSDLTSLSEFACPLASVGSKTPIVHAGADLVGVAGYDNGVTTWQIVNWVVTTSLAVVPSGTVTAMTAVEVGPNALVMWSTASACWVDVMTSGTDGTALNRPAVCGSPRLASDGTSVVGVYEQPSGVAIVRGTGSALDPAAIAATIPGARSPRVVHDGKRYWIGYLDATGAVMLATLADDNTYVTGPANRTASHAGFELVVQDGLVWLAATDGGGQLATDLLCIR